MRKCMYAYAWDFLYEGTDQVLQTLKYMDIDTVAVAASYHAGKFILPHNPNSRVYFPEDGTVYFQPDIDLFTDSEIAENNSSEISPDQPKLLPKPAQLLKGEDALLTISQRCKEHGLKLQAWTVGMHNTRLGTLHPELCCRNCFGDIYPYALCPAQPDVQRYALGLIRNLSASYSLDTIMLESFSYPGFAHGYHHEFFGVNPDRLCQDLLSLCFCDSCRKNAESAGLDIERIIQLCAEYTDTSIHSEINTENSMYKFCQQYLDIATYLRVRCETVTELYKKACDIAGKHQVPLDYFGPVFQSSPKEAVVEGVDLSAIEPYINNHVVSAGSSSVADTLEAVEYAMKYFPPERIVLSVNLGASATPDRFNLSQKMDIVKSKALAGCNFYNYSTIPLTKLQWLRGW